MDGFIFTVMMQFLNGKKLPTVYAFALVEHIRRFSEARLLRVRLNLAGEFSNFNTNYVKSCPRLLNMRSHISEPERQLYFLKVILSNPFSILLVKSGRSILIPDLASSLDFILMMLI